jgi:hypothetical protein
MANLNFPVLFLTKESQALCISATGFHFAFPRRATYILFAVSIEASMFQDPPCNLTRPLLTL